MRALLARLFGSAPSLATELAVARVRAELAERDNADLRARLTSTAAEYARFREQVFARQGVLAAPLTDTAAVSPRPPIAGIFGALSVQSIRDDKPLPAPAPMTS